MRRHSKRRTSAIAVVVSIAMAFSLTIAPGLASAKGSVYGPASSSALSGVPEWAVDDGQNLQDYGVATQAGLPVTYDLRAEGLVTPVKFQNPWGSCWAFGGTAAAETSLLSAYGSTYEKSKLDLSEKHLTYFALQPILESEDQEQAGEGLHTIDPSPNAAYDAGGQPVYITTLYSQGVGPMPESLFPYRGKEGLTMLDYVTQHPEEAVKNQVAKELGITWDQYVDKGYARAVAAGSTLTKEEFETSTIERISASLIEVATNSPQYSDQDDWSIPATNADGMSNRLLTSGVVLKNGNVLPEYWTGGAEPNSACTDAIKQELVNGRGVTIMYYAEPGSKYATKPNGENKNHSQYVFDKVNINHGVCIVGWDDNYSAENFYHTVQVVDENGQLVTDVDATAKTAPPGNGAWIVKNSWGSETDATAENADDLGNVMSKGTFGNLDENGKATGFFYLSYYDKTIRQVETMEFSANLGTEDGFATLQYDYMPANSGFYTTPASNEVTSSANVFSADDVDVIVKSVSTRTSETNTRVTFAIYQLNDNAKDPTDGEMVYRTSQNFEYGGFHRLDLDKPITFKAGKKFSVVSTASTLGESGKRLYSVSANKGLSQEASEYAIEHLGAKLKAYSTAVVNEGESYLYDGKEWKDWSEYIDTLPSNAETQEVMPSDSYTEVCPIDNFSIKVYGEIAKAPLSSYAGAAKEAGFKDLNADAWYMKEGFTNELGVVVSTFLDYTVKKGLMSGYSATQFAPDEPLTRGMAATIIYRMATGKTAETTDNDVETKFSDVPPGEWYTAAVAWCAEKGVITGYDGTDTFGPDDPVSREQLATMIARYCEKVVGMESVGADVSKFKDAAQMSTWAKEGIAFCAAKGIVSGIGDTGNFDPKGQANRAQTAKIIAVTDRMVATS